jgi:glycerol-3-phosphate dehydrogenase
LKLLDLNDEGEAITNERVIRACKEEYARNAVDILGRRAHLALLNTQKAYEAIPDIVTMMGKELDWPPEKVAQEIAANQELFKAEYN